MSKVLITGSAGLIGSEAVEFFCTKGYEVFGIDNNMRQVFFGSDANTTWRKKALQEKYKNYYHFDIDIRNNEAITKLFKFVKFDLIIHTAAQPSHDWAAKEPVTDFDINARATLLLLDAMYQHCPDAVFIFTSTNKVYGDNPNRLPLQELDTRFELAQTHHYFDGIDESMSIDNCLHSLFGVSKTSADLLVQEYGRYFGLKTIVFRGGCLTGPMHSGTMLHGFLSYLIRCCLWGRKYYIYGYKGKQVRDNIHSADLVNAFYHVFKNPKTAEVYNIGGGRQCNCSVLEAIELCQEITGKMLEYEYVDKNRVGDHIWWISSMHKFKSHYPQWQMQFDLKAIIRETYEIQRILLK